MSTEKVSSVCEPETLLLGSEAWQHLYFARYRDAIAFVRGVSLAASSRDERLEMGMYETGLACRVTVGLTQRIGVAYGHANRELSRLIDLGAAAAGLDLTARD